MGYTSFLAFVFKRTSCVLRQQARGEEESPAERARGSFCWRCLLFQQPVVSCQRCRSLAEDTFGYTHCCLFSFNAGVSERISCLLKTYLPINLLLLKKNRSTPVLVQKFPKMPLLSPLPEFHIIFPTAFLNLGYTGKQGSNEWVEFNHIIYGFFLCILCLKCTEWFFNFMTSDLETQYFHCTGF